YENQDWFIPSPALPVKPEDLALTPDQIRETLNYFRKVGRVTAEGSAGAGAGCADSSRASPPPGFDPELFQELSTLPDAELRECLGEYPDFIYHVARDRFGRLYFRVIRTLLLDRVLCSNRVSQMTKTYNDIEAVTRLLEELTARIGKELLTTQGLLEARVSSLEGDLRSANDQITQLRHDLIIKTDLLQVLTNDTEEPLSPTEQEAACAAALRRRTGALERENRALRDEASRLAAGADSAELAEQQLLRDIAHQLSSANSEATVLGSELFEERQRASDLQYQLESTTARLTASERNFQQVHIENCCCLLLSYGVMYFHVIIVRCRSDMQKSQPTWRKLKSSYGSFASAASPRVGSCPAWPLQLGYCPLAYTGRCTHLSSMQKVFETVQCASRWSNGSGPSIPGSDVADGPAARPSYFKPPPNPFSHDSFLDDSSDAESDDLYPAGRRRARGRAAPPHAARDQLAARLAGRLTRLLEDHEGVGVRGARSAAALGMRAYRLSDVEEDDDMLRLPQSSLIYTFTN
ncbi:Selenide, partial [Operophtera brumata]